MVAYPRDVEPANDIAYDLARNSLVTMFWREAVMAKTTAWLHAHGYQLLELTCAHWRASADMLREVATAFEFPSYFGHNLNALNDCLSDVANYDYDYDAAEHAAGTVLTLAHFDAFAKQAPAAADSLLKIYAGQARTAASSGIACYVLCSRRTRNCN